jgi:CHAT domain-containing protein/tetratricopeptide (TPR) repeat protein
MKSIPPIPFLLSFLVFLFFGCSGKPADEQATPVCNVNPDSIEILISQADSFHATGVDLQSAFQYREAIKKYTISVEKREALLNCKNLMEESLFNTGVLEGIIKGYNNQGVSYSKSGDYEMAMQFLNTCLKKQIEFDRLFNYSNPIRRGRVHQSLGQIYVVLGEISEAESQYENALVYFSEGGSDIEVANVHSNLSALYSDWRDAGNTVLHAGESLRISNSPDRKDPLLNMGNGLIMQGNYAEAITQYDSAYVFINQFPRPPNLGYIADIFHNKAIALRRQKVLDKALIAVDSAIRINSDLNTPHRPVLLASNYNNKADIYYDMANYPEALKWYDRSIRTFIGENDDFDLERLDPSAVNVVISDKAGFLEAVAGRALTQAAMGQVGDALHSFENAVRLINEVRRSYNDPASRIRLAAITKKIFENAIAVSLEMNDIARAFEYAERSKAFTLLEAVRLNRAMDFAGIDPDSLRMEQDLRIRIAETEQRYAAADSLFEKIKLLEEKQKLQNDLEALVKELRKNPGYEKLMSDFELMSAAQVQQSLLREDQALIEYFVGEDRTYLFFIPKEGRPQVFTADISRERIAHEVRELTYAMYIPKLEAYGDEEIKRLQKKYTDRYTDSVYAEYGAHFYRILLQPVLEGPGADARRLVIIPDDVLGYLPFDALLTSPPESTGDYGSYPFVANDRQISYCYSAALLKEMQDQSLRHPSRRKMLAFALNEVEFEQQLRSLRRMFNNLWGRGRGFVVALKGAGGAEEKLREEAARYSCVHFSTHGEVNDREPNYSYLKMLRNARPEEDSLLQLFEIYNTPLNADLVVTSACKTGTGQLFRGEGIMSLARGFSYAGAGSIVTTLWAVQTHESELLINEFYRNLQKEGTAKDEALFQAKKAYFESDQLPSRMKHPFYWAGLIPIGDMDAMNLPVSPPLWRSLLLLLSAAAVLIAILGFSVRKLRRA